jgi:acetate kinase
MMTAKEAKTLTTNYLTAEADKHLQKIEGHIQNCASRGNTAMYYSNGIGEADSRIQAKVCNTLNEAGYKVNWSGSSLYISWAEA